MRPHGKLLAACCLSLGFAAAAVADDVRCTVTVVACGEVSGKPSPLTTLKTGACYEAKLADIGKAPAE